MDDINVISTIVSGITYITPLAVIIWKVSKYDSKINDAEKRLKEMEENYNDWKNYETRVSLLEQKFDQKLTNLQDKFESEKVRTDRMEKSLVDIKENLSGVSTKIDMLLKYNIKDNE